VTPPCRHCRTGTTHEEKRRRHDGGVRLLGWLLLVPGIGATLLMLLVTALVHTGGRALLQFVNSGELAQKAQVDVVALEVRSYRDQHGSLPAKLGELAQPDPLHGGEAWVGRETLVDRWGHDLVLRRGDGAGEFEVVSLGPRGEAAASESHADEWISSGRPLDPTRVSTDPSPSTAAEQEQLLAALRLGSTVALGAAVVAAATGGWLLRGRRVVVCDQCGASDPA
jgi:hypothetical protein